MVFVHRTPSGPLEEACRLLRCSIGFLQCLEGGLALTRRPEQTVLQEEEIHPV